MSFSFKEIISAFIVLFAIIDITGSLPIIIGLREKGAKIGPLKVALISFAILVAFLFAGEGLLSLFGVEINSFAVAGAMLGPRRARSSREISKPSLVLHRALSRFSVSAFRFEVKRMQ